MAHAASVRSVLPMLGGQPMLRPAPVYRINLKVPPDCGADSALDGYTQSKKDETPNKTNVKIKIFVIFPMIPSSFSFKGL
jgi:hypothetical protein